MTEHIGFIDYTKKKSRTFIYDNYCIIKYNKLQIIYKKKKCRTELNYISVEEYKYNNILNLNVSK
jgi:hypothetical protein